MRAADRLVFIGLISMADDMGRLLDNVKQIDAFVFPYTTETSKQALDRLDQAGRILRGETSSGQRIIQIRNWHHQKIEKPNIAGALPPLVGVEDETTAYRARKRIPGYLKDEVWARDGGVCQDCGRENLRRSKKDRYDRGQDLGEVDHDTEAADGGEASIENLRLLCMPCNRKKAGLNRRRREAERRENDTRRVSDESPTNQRHVADLSPPRSTTLDQRPTTNDQRPPSSTAGGDVAAAFEVDGHLQAYLAYRRAHRMPDGLDQALRQTNSGSMTGGARYEWPVIGQALVEMRAASADFSPAALRSFCQRLARGDHPATTPAPDRETARRDALEAARRFQERGAAAEVA